MSAFQLFADANRHLHDIAISVFCKTDRSAKSALHLHRELVAVFRKCRQFRFPFPCSNEQLVTRTDLMCICKVLPCRGVDVHVRIGEVDYRYPQ